MHRVQTEVTKTAGFTTKARRTQGQCKAEQQPNISLTKHVTLIQFTQNAEVLSTVNTTHRYNAVSQLTCLSAQRRVERHCSVNSSSNKLLRYAKPRISRVE